MKKFVVLAILIGAMLGCAAAYKTVSLQNKDVTSHQIKVRDLETYKVTYFKEGKVFVRTVPTISKKEDLIEYLDKRKKAVSYLSAKQPSRIVYVTVTFNKKLSIEEFRSFLKKHKLEVMNYMYKSYPEGIGVFSTEIPRKLIKEMEDELKEKYGDDFRLVDGVVSFKTKLLAKDLTKLQRDAMVLLVDPGPLEVYVENPNAEVIAAVDYIYPSYERFR